MTAAELAMMMRGSANAMGSADVRRSRLGAKDAVWSVILPAMAGDEAQTIQAVLGGDVERYAELVNKYQAGALRLAFSLLANDEDAKDAAQDAFIRAYQSLGRFRGHAKFSTWLYRIVVNACTDHVRRRIRQPVAAGSFDGSDPDPDQPSLFVDVSDPGDGPDAQLANRELGRQLSAAIGALSMKQRTAFLLHHVHGLPLDEVAGIMDCRTGTVKSHIFRATERVKTQLRPWLDKEASS